MRGNLIAALVGLLTALVVVELFAGFKKGAITPVHSSVLTISDQQVVEAGRNALQTLMSSRICGSPATDAYAHVDVACLRASPVARWWLDSRPSPQDLVAHIERRADYDGVAVAWGIGNKASSIEECAARCRDHVPPDPYDTLGFGALPCNAFVYCTEEVCFEPDAHKHTKNDCWLKFTEAPADPEVNMRGTLHKEQRRRHANVPKKVQWHAGVLLPKGVILSNGTWSPRYEW